MADESTKTDANDSRPEMVKITLDNREVEVPKEAADILQQKEHDLQSGYDVKLRDERASIQSEQEKHDALFAEDVEFYNTHPQEEWQFYKPKVDGGNGYTGKPATVPPVSTPNATSTPAFNNDPKVTSLEQEVKRLRGVVEQVSDGVIRGGAEQVKSVRDDLSNFLGEGKKYPCANVAEVNAELGNYYDTHNNTHAPPAEIERIIKAVNAKGIKMAIAFNKGKTIAPEGTTMPPAGGSPPSGTPKKTLSIANIDDFDEVVDRATQFVEESGLFQD